MTPAYLGLVLLVSGLGAFTDIRSGCVRNYHLIVAVTLWVMLTIGTSSPVEILPLSVNVILAVIMAVVFYLTDIWAPGDCKLYIVISLIFPMRAYVVREGNIFPALDFAVYSFALGYIFLLATAMTCKTSVNKNFSPRFSLKHCLSVLSNTGAISLINALLNILAPKFFYANQILCILFSAALLLILKNRADTARKIIGIIGLIYILFLGSWPNACVSLVTASAMEIMNSRVRADTYSVEMMPFAPFIAGAVVIQVLRFLLLGR